MRPWLALETAGAKYQMLDVGMYTSPNWREKILAFSGAGKVPILVDGNLSVHESLAICEYVHEAFPAAQLWPPDRALRARGRAISCEMLSSFSALRSAMPTNLRGRAKSTPGGEAVTADVSRLLDIFEASMASSTGDFLLGDFSIADCMFFPVLTRFRTYGVPLTPGAARYSQNMFALPAVKKLEQLAALTPAIEKYDALLG
jgi:glutathione S-transferase